jgi:hypothetical protein
MQVRYICSGIFAYQVGFVSRFEVAEPNVPASSQQGSSCFKKVACMQGVVCVDMVS